VAGFTSTPVRILVADDNHDAADTLAILLRLWGYEVRAAYDGLTAYRRALAFRPHVAILDVQMPGLHGAEVAWRLQQQVGAEDVIFIAASATDPLDSRLDGYAGVFDAFLLKPCNLEGLEALLANCTVHAAS
jgi:CheY-like chemotaxis protein